MFATTFKQLLGRAALALSLALSANAAMADVMLTVKVNTASFGPDGYLDFQFNGAGMGEPVATATMSQLNGFDMSQFSPMGDVTQIGNDFKFVNTAGLNDLLYAATFGGMFSLNLTFAGDAIDTATSRFSVQAFDSLGNGVGGIADGLLLTLDWTKIDPTAAAGVVANVLDDSASVADAPSAAVPEPSSIAMAMLGLGMLGFVRRKRA